MLGSVNLHCCDTYPYSDSLLCVCNQTGKNEKMMKAIFISYNQAYGQEIVEILENNGQRGFTRWEDMEGRGNYDGEPHYGNHAWPVMNNAILTIVPDSIAGTILEELGRKDAAYPDLGLRAFSWAIEEMI